ncbi:hypothetical protein PIB30_016556 [Stylosanthes scabra]|uniref:Uncharacterized protein n=1 Tax=Stylosanthes scabra TaxID=79078 RepID=A0ABU6R7N3_9FABA|nr:hypothetical protein [Stylosanthes scabra]
MSKAQSASTNAMILKPVHLENNMPCSTVPCAGPLWGAKSSGSDFREEPSEETQVEKTPHPTQNLKVSSKWADQPSALIPLVGPPWGAKPSGRDFREEPREGTQDEKTPHPTQNLKVLSKWVSHLINSSLLFVSFNVGLTLVPTHT